MTPCETEGYKVGDKFEVILDLYGFRKGQVVTLYQDDGSDCPLFKGDNDELNHAEGECGAYMRLGTEVKPISVKSLTQQLADAVKKRDKHRAKLGKWHNEVEWLTGQLERVIEDATGLRFRIETVTDAKIEELNGEIEDISIPDGVDPDDPKTWRERDVIVCVEQAAPCHCVTIGEEYLFDGLREYPAGIAASVERDDDGDANWCGCPDTGFSKFRFVRRPS